VLSDPAHALAQVKHKFSETIGVGHLELAWRRQIDLARDKEETVREP
jgi:hypothetical protein